MSKKYKKSVYLGIVVNRDFKVMAMSNLLYDPSVKPRIGHVKTDRYMEFDYDQFVKKGYAYTDDKGVVVKNHDDVRATVLDTFGRQAFNSFIASIVRNIDLEHDLNWWTLTGQMVVDVAMKSLERTGQKLCKEELKTDGLCRIDKFTINRDDND